MTKRHIGIALLVLLNGSVIFFGSALALFSFAIIVAHVGPIRGAEIANEITQYFIIISLISVLIVGGGNFLTLRKLIQSTRPLLKTCIITIIGFLICSAFFVYCRQDFINYQNTTSVRQLESVQSA